MSSESIAEKLYQQYGRWTLLDKDKQLFDELVAKDFNGVTTFADYDASDSDYARDHDRQIFLFNHDITRNADNPVVGFVIAYFLGEGGRHLYIDAVDCSPQGRGGAGILIKRLMGITAEPPVVSLLTQSVFMYRSMVKTLSVLNYEVYPNNNLLGENRALAEVEFVRQNFAGAGYVGHDGFRLVHDRSGEMPGRDQKIPATHRNPEIQAYFDSLINSDQAEDGDKLVVVGLRR